MGGFEVFLLQALCWGLPLSVWGGGGREGPPLGHWTPRLRVWCVCAVGPTGFHSQWPHHPACSDLVLAARAFWWGGEGRLV